MSKSQIGDKNCDRMIKILLIGNSGVGKSSILMQYSDKKFVHNYYNTIGVDYIKYMNINGLKIKLQIWDTAGQDRFKTITSSYYRGADGIIVVYDITDRTSFDHVKTWLEEIQRFVDEKTKKYIVGNKNDLQERRQVTPHEAQQMTKRLNIPFKQTSARLATNVDEIFQDIVQRILQNSPGAMSQSNKNLPVGQKPQNNDRHSVNIKEMMEQKKKEQSGSCCDIY